MFRAARILIVLLALSTGGQARGDDDSAAVEWVQATIAELGQASERGASQSAIHAILSARFDLRSMALAALPEDVRASDNVATLNAYVTAYGHFLAVEFITRATGGGAGTVRILGTRQPNPAVILVGTEVSAPGHARRQVEWYLRSADPVRIVNAAVDGILVTSQQRRDFADTLQAGGLAALTQALRSEVTGPVAE